ncbi:ABC transporter substrate-binding protein [Paenarthrobacter sp. NPDC089675]|uniref:ABC transporter substrate-binding protein n=1 Tax=Paenarthrobacter sp. NPDC089675 TaxID=3364376 RepID=UPI00381FFF16
MYRRLLRTSRKAIVVVAVVTAASAGLVACNGGEASQSGGEKVLRLALPSAPSSVNPALIGTGIPDQYYVEPAYDPLIFRAGDGSLQPGLATKWGFVDDANKVFQISLREGVKFADGAELSADGVKKWFEYWAKSGGLFAQRFQQFEQIEVVDKQTIKLHLKASDPLWPTYLTQNRYGYVGSPNAVDNPQALGTSTDGAGPYALVPEETNPGNHYVYKARSDYWNKDRKLWDRVEITVISDANAAVSAMQSGQVDFVVGQARDAESAKSAGLAVTHVPYLWDGLILMDRAGQKTPALGSLQVRQALNYAVDRKAVANTVFGEYGKANASMVVNGYKSYADDTENLYSYDPAKAKQLLAQAGYKDGFDLTVCVWNRNGTETTFLQSLLGYLQDVGVRVHIKDLVDSATAVAARRALECPSLAFYGQISESNQLAVEQLLPNAGLLNPFKTDDPELAKLLATAQSADAQSIEQAQKNLQKYIVENAFYSNYSVSDAVFFTSSTVTAPNVSDAQPIPTLIDLQPKQ